MQETKNKNEQICISSYMSLDVKNSKENGIVFGLSPGKVILLILELRVMINPP